MLHDPLVNETPAPCPTLQPKSLYKKGQMVCLLYKLTFHSRGERANKSTRNNDTGHFFVKEGNPACEVDASVGHHRDRDAACPNVPGA